MTRPGRPPSMRFVDFAEARGVPWYIRPQYTLKHIGRSRELCYWAGPQFGFRVCAVLRVP